MKNRAQTSVEYLLIIAGIVVLVSLVVFIAVDLVNKQGQTSSSQADKLNYCINHPDAKECINP